VPSLQAPLGYWLLCLLLPIQNQWQAEQVQEVGPELEDLPVSLLLVIGVKNLPAVPEWQQQKQ
jgi:hypothetical protein